ncbi:MAG: N-6 DNA methylase [Candidatus Limnocylindrales bacterium]
MSQAIIETPQEAKARGAFYTPAGLTRFLARWAIRTPSDRVLEPSCGDGAFVAAVTERFADLGADDLVGRLTGIEREPIEAEKVRVLAPNAQILTSDFFDVEPSAMPSMDAVIGNPPYIRYHGFTGEAREKGLRRARAQGVELTNLASSWAHFVVHSVSFLAPHGRLALVLPAELLHTDYGGPVRELLLRRFGSVIVVAFDRGVFADAQVDALLLLASNDNRRGLRVVRVLDEQTLNTLDVGTYADLAAIAPQGRWSGSMDAEAGSVYEEARASGVASPLGAIASVDIGFVSGANDFFILSHEEAASLRLPADVFTPTLRRPGDVAGLLASNGDLRLLLDLAHRPEPNDKQLLAYLQKGKALGVAARYKCRVRRPWYAVPLPRSKPDAFLPYMSHLGPRLIVNDASAWSSNLLHGVKLGPSAPPPRVLAAAMASSLTLLSAEIEGRAYGGGVLKLETKEAERVLVPTLSPVATERLAALFDVVDTLIRAGQTEEAARRVDGALGLDHLVLWPAHLTYRARRLGRRRAGAAH